ncbi:hypothetical protein JW835_09840, partial [bacterium]|nr:hypothetical protein [bacterium]
MFYRILRISAVIFLISSSSYSSTFKDAFDANTHHNSVGYSDSTNITGLLAWNESYAMMAFLSMFRATNDADYLNKLIFHAKNVIGNIDDSIYIVDPSRGIDVTMGPAWNTHLLTNDSLGVYHDYAKVVGSGMICYPIADFAQLVKNNLCLQDSIYPATGETYNAIADTFITIVDKVIAAHDDQWSVSDFGYKFRNVSWLHLANWPKGGVGGRILPINMQLVMGRTLLMMYLANGNPSYLQKVKCLIYRFKYHTDLKISGDQYLWKYWKKYEPDKCEDISHGSICADFSRLCYIHGDEIMSSINFSQDDTTRFASIVTESLYQQPLYIHYRIDGSGDNSLDLRIGRWLHYSRYHKDIYQIVADMFSQNAIYEQGKWLGGSDFLGLANLVLYKEYFDPIAVYRGNGPNSDWAGITAGDFNDDGVDEIAAVRNYDGNFYV